MPPFICRLLILSSVKISITLYFALFSCFSLKGQVADTLYVLKPVIDMESIDKTEVKPLDKFCREFADCFRRSLKENVSNQCDKKFVFIDIDKEEDALRHANLNGFIGDFALAKKYFRGELTKQTDDYILKIILKQLNNTIEAEDYVKIKFSEIDAYPDTLADKLSKSLLLKMCKPPCEPHIKDIAPYKSNTYKKNLEKAFDLLIFKYDPKSSRADKIDNDIVKLKPTLSNPPEQYELSYHVFHGNFWLIKVKQSQSKGSFYPCPKQILHRSGIPRRYKFVKKFLRCVLPI